jgi:hypothetical protein
MLAQPFTKPSSTVWFRSVKLFGPDNKPKMEFASEILFVLLRKSTLLASFTNLHDIDIC